MRKFIKEQILEIFKTLYEAHGSVRTYIEKKETDNAVSVLGECQNTAVQIGDIMDGSEGEGSPVIHLLEEYCETVYQVSVGINEDITGTKARKMLDKSLLKAENSVKNDIKVSLEIVFMPYKASMWDSLESVWRAADEDPDCEAYVVPIPYYDRNPDHSFGKYHYEGNDYPEYVPIVYYEKYDLASRRPDVIYIHNPYDANNYVTSVDPKYYSSELKKYTECLVYIPYYTTSGGMSYAQSSCPAYYYSDYIVIQSENYRGFFDSLLPDKKFLPFGSPKFDRVINMCKNPPEPPLLWKKRIAGKKVYFYNTSLGGMLGYTKAFMKKVRYVFDRFKGRDDVCILWRPHPLLESTIASMRPQYMEEFAELKRYFIDNDIGIYDDTSDITMSIALSDVYIGDAGTSVTSLFGVAGKPVFVLDNVINELPDEEDLRIFDHVKIFNVYSDKKWFVTLGDHLLYSENDDFKYKCVCRLSEFDAGSQYLYAITVSEKTFVCPSNAFDIVQVDTKGVVKRYPLEIIGEQTSFNGAVRCGKYIFLIPLYYPAVVRFDTENGNAVYITENVDIIAGEGSSGRVRGGYCVYNDALYIGAALSSDVLKIDAQSCRTEIIKPRTAKNGGCKIVFADDDKLWITPFDGKYIISYDLLNAVTHEYNDMPEGFQCNNIFYGTKEDSHALGYPMTSGDDIIYPPFRANMFVKINRKTHAISSWNSPVDVSHAEEIGYKICCFNKALLYDPKITGWGKCYIYSCCERRLYEFDDTEQSIKEVSVDFDSKTTVPEETGFGKISRFLRYACLENAHNSLDDLLNDTITGMLFDKDKQLEAYGDISADMDGNCGKRTHDFIKT